jgi:hypothetical protein
MVRDTSVAAAPGVAGVPAAEDAGMAGIDAIAGMDAVAGAEPAPAADPEAAGSLLSWAAIPALPAPDAVIHAFAPLELE